MTHEPDQHWTLDKRIPVALVATLVLQLMGGVWMFAEMRSDIGENRDDISDLQEGLRAVTLSVQSQAVQLGRIETNTSAMGRDIDRVLRLLENDK